MTRLVLKQVRDSRMSVEPASDERGQLPPYAARCLPMRVASALGWHVLCPFDFAATWNGGRDPSDLDLIGPEEAVGSGEVGVRFGYGVLTFYLPWVFETGPGYDLLIQGPANARKALAAPLSAVVETGGIELSFTFTMNWAMTAPGTVVFRRGEPIACFLPIPRLLLQGVRPELIDLDDDEAALEAFRKWQDGRKVAEEAHTVENTYWRHARTLRLRALEVDDRRTAWART